MTRKGLKGMVKTSENFINIELPCGIECKVNNEREYKLKFKLHKRKCDVCNKYIKLGGVEEVEEIHTLNKGWA